MKNGDIMFERLISLIGEEKFNLIQSQKVLLIGVGGVGSFALESLVRNGFINITIVDFDKIDLSNINRQLITNINNIGQYKVEEAKKRCETINSKVNITIINKKINKDNIKNILDNDFDYVIDACDTVEVKFSLIENSLHYNYKLITALGTAKKMDPTKLEITTLDKTINDPLARILRNKVKKAHINKKIPVVFSKEIPVEVDALGSTCLVPPVAGILCVSYIVNDLLKSHLDIIKS